MARVSSDRSPLFSTEDGTYTSQGPYKKDTAKEQESANHTQSEQLYSWRQLFGWTDPVGGAAAWESSPADDSPLWRSSSSTVGSPYFGVRTKKKRRRGRWFRGLKRRRRRISFSTSTGSNASFAHGRWGRGGKSRKRGKHRALTITLVVLASLILLFIWSERKMRPIIEQKAASQVQTTATRIINEAITKEIEGENLQYSDLIDVEKDISGKITALKTDMVRINRFKSVVTETIIHKMGDLDSEELTIPLGNLINEDWLSGRGPKIPLKIVPISTVETDFQNTFASAGINQTRHQIWMAVGVDVEILLPFSLKKAKVNTSVIIAETVIVGEVPSSYAQFGSSDTYSSARAFDAAVPE